MCAAVCRCTDTRRKPRKAVLETDATTYCLRRGWEYVGAQSRRLLTVCLFMLLGFRTMGTNYLLKELK